MSNDDTPEKGSQKSKDVARRIWLAGVGAYGRAFDEGRDMARSLTGNLSDKTSDAFETLAERGEKIEMAAKVKGAQLAGKASGLSEDLQNTLAIDDRIQAMRDRLSGGGGSDDRIDAVEARLARIEAKLDTLLGTAKKAPAKRTATKRTATQRTKPAPAKKPAAKKPPAKRTTAKKPAAK